MAVQAIKAEARPCSRRSLTFASGNCIAASEEIRTGRISSAIKPPRRGQEIVTLLPHRKRLTATLPPDRSSTLTGG